MEQTSKNASVENKALSKLREYMKSSVKKENLIPLENFFKK